MKMSWFKSGIRLLVLVLYCQITIAQNPNCETDPKLSTPHISNHTSTNPTSCNSFDGSITITDIAVAGGGDQRKNEWQFRVNSSAWTSSTSFKNLAPGVL